MNADIDDASGILLERFSVDSSFPSSDPSSDLVLFMGAEFDDFSVTLDSERNLLCIDDNVLQSNSCTTLIANRLPH